MVVTVIVVLLVVWTVIGLVLALLIGRTARVADDRQQDAMLRGASSGSSAVKPARVPVRA